MYLARCQSDRIRPCGDRRGTTAVEFAMTAPILFLIFFASLEFSRYNMIQQTANNAAFEATRKCILPGYAATDGRTTGLNVLSQASISSGTVTIYDADANTVISSTIPTTTQRIKATVSVPLSSNLWVRPLYLGSGTITKSFTLTCDWVNAAHY